MGPSAAVPAQENGDLNDRSPEQWDILQPGKIITEIYILAAVQKKPNNLSNKLNKLQNYFLECYCT